MNKRRKDKNKQIICIILFIFVLLSGVFYAVYTTIGKELLSKDNNNTNPTTILKEEPNDKVTVPKEEEPPQEDKPLANKTTTENKNTSKNTTKKPTTNNTTTNTTKPTENKVFNGLEVIKDPGLTNNTTNSNTTPGNNSGSSGSGSNSSESDKYASISFSGVRNVMDSNVSASISGSVINISGNVYVEITETDPNKMGSALNRAINNMYFDIGITAPKIYRTASYLDKSYYKFDNASDGTLTRLTPSNPTFEVGASYKPESSALTQIKAGITPLVLPVNERTVWIDWGTGTYTKYTIKLAITVNKYNPPAPVDPTPGENTSGEETNED